MFRSLLTGLVLLPGAALAVTIGTGGTGTHTISNFDVDERGYSNNTFDFDSGFATDTDIIYNNLFYVKNLTDNTEYFSSASGTPPLPAGSVSSTSSSITNANADLLNGLSLTLDVIIATISVPEGGPVVRYDWEFSNSSGTAKDVRLVWFLDIDSDLVGNYQDDLVARTYNITGEIVGMGLGEDDGSGNVNLANGVLMGSNSPASAYVGFSTNDGPSNWWNGNSTFAGIGLTDVDGIDASLADKVQNDGNNDGLADSGQDSGAALQYDIQVPAGGSTTIELIAQWGNMAVLGPYSDVAEWSLY